MSPSFLCSHCVLLLCAPALELTPLGASINAITLLITIIALGNSENRNEHFRLEQVLYLPLLPSSSSSLLSPTPARCSTSWTSTPPTRSPRTR